MYGMVNKALEGMVVAAHGEATWRGIKERAGVDIEVFISHDGYDDSVTYGLVGAASEVLAVPVRELLVEFGKYWVKTTAREGYGHLLDAAGRTLPEFLRNLPTFHTRVVLLMPHLRPPVFRLSDETEQAVTLHYFSERPGLSPFVEGVLLGLAEIFGMPVVVTPLSSRAAGAEHDTFRVEWAVEPSA